MELLKQKTGAAAPIRDITTTEFEAAVLMASQQTPVIVDFWAPWCGPCKQLMPVLEKLVRETNGKVQMVKVDIDKNPELAQALRVQSVPTVYAFYQGQPVDGFMGAQPETQIKAFIANLLKIAGANAAPDGLDLEPAVEQAEALMASGDHITAEEIFRQILQHDPRQPRAVAGYLRCLTAERKFSDARKLLANLPPELQKDGAVVSAKAALELAETLKVSGSPAELQKKLEKNPNDHQSRFDLALNLYVAGAQEEAIDALIEIVRRDRQWNEEAARAQLLKFFEALGNTHPLTVSGRRKLSSVLFS